jgi:hypothetical protein
MMTELTLKPTFIDCGSNQVYDVLDPRQEHFCAGQVRLAPDPRIKELKTFNDTLTGIIKELEEQIAGLKIAASEEQGALLKQIKELEAENKSLVKFLTMDDASR